MVPLLYPEGFRKKSSRATSRRDFVLKSLDQSLERYLPEILAAACTHGHQIGRHFLVADDELVRQPFQAMFSYFIGNFLVTQIGHNTQTGLA